MKKYVSLDITSRTIISIFIGIIICSVFCALITLFLYILYFQERSIIFLLLIILSIVLLVVTIPTLFYIRYNIKKRLWLTTFMNVQTLAERMREKLLSSHMSFVEKQSYPHNFLAPGVLQYEFTLNAINVIVSGDKFSSGVRIKTKPDADPLMLETIKQKANETLLRKLSFQEIKMEYFSLSSDFKQKRKRTRWHRASLGYLHIVFAFIGCVSFLLEPIIGGWGLSSAIYWSITGIIVSVMCFGIVLLFIFRRPEDKGRLYKLFYFPQKYIIFKIAEMLTTYGYNGEFVEQEGSLTTRFHGFKIRRFPVQITIKVSDENPTGKEKRVFVSIGPLLLDNKEFIGALKQRIDDALI